MAKKRTKASKKKANQRRVVVGASGGEFSLGSLDSDNLTSEKKSKAVVKKSTPLKSKSRIMRGLDVSQISKDLRKTLLVTTAVLAVLLVILNYF